MFQQYPKHRLELPENYKVIYVDYYRNNRKGCTTASSLAQKMESWMHKEVAADVKNINRGVATLEIGAGTLNHPQYEVNTQPYDIVEPFKDLFASLIQLNRIRNIYQDISHISIEQPRYERIISIATLEHMIDLPYVVAKVGLLLVPQGHFRVGIPSEGTGLWALGWKMTTGLEFKFKYKLDYGVLMKHEHVNTAREIKEVLGYFFTSIKCRVLGLNENFSLYIFYDCSDPDTERCSRFLSDQK